MSKENEIAFLCKRLKGLREKNNCRIIYIAQEASDIYHCKVDIIAEDTDHSA